MAGLPWVTSARNSPGEAVNRAEQMVLRYEAGYTYMQETLLNLRRELSFFHDPLEQSYWMARAEFLLGGLTRSIGDRRGADALFQRSLHFAEEALARREFSDGFRILADSLGQLLTLRGILFQLSNGLRARDAAIMALELDWSNLRAHVSVGAYYLNAPEVAGGDVEYATTILANVIADRRSNQIERFLAYGFLALGYDELDDRRRAHESYREAAQIFPRNPWLTSVADEIEAPPS